MSESTTSPSTPSRPTTEADQRRERVLTIPNIITITRLCCSGVLIWLALTDRSVWFAIVYGVLVLSDWLDGKIARWFHMRTVLGARLDSIADAVLYGCLVAGLLLLRPEFVRAEAVLIASMLVSYASAVLASLARFGRWPAYHTRAAKTCWFLVSVGAIVLLADGPEWPARLALAAVILTNVEAFLIAFVLPEWEADVASVWHAYRRRRKD